MRKEHIEKLLDQSNADDQYIISFIEFLKERKLYSEYVREIMYVGVDDNPNYIFFSEKLVRLLRETINTDPGPERFVVSCDLFVWQESKRGWKFWDKIDDEWQDELEVSRGRK